MPMTVTIPSHGDILRRVSGHREKWPKTPPVTPDPVGPGQESVWDYPRPPEVREVEHDVRVVWAGQVIAGSERARKVCETAGAPVYYLPPDDVARQFLIPADGLSICEWKGAAIYYDLMTGGQRAEIAAFSYPEPLNDLGMGYDKIAGWIAFYAGRVDEAWVGDMRARPQPGGLYAGWVTPNIVGPIKGAPGTEGW